MNLHLFMGRLKESLNPSYNWIIHIYTRFFILFYTIKGTFPKKNLLSNQIGFIWYFLGFSGRNLQNKIEVRSDIGTCASS